MVGVSLCAYSSGNEILPLCSKEKLALFRGEVETLDTVDLQIEFGKGNH